MTSALPPRARGVGIAGTTLAHGALVALALYAAHRGTSSHALVYEVNLVAAPLPSSSRAVAPAPPAPKPVPTPAKPRTAKPAPKKPPAAVKHDAPAPLAKPVLTPAQGVKPSTGESPVTLHQDGLVFPFQDYLDNIVGMIYKRWNHAVFRPGLQTKIAFVISRDGTVPDSSYIVIKSSGYSLFDDAGRAAIESVVAHHEFGSLPAGFSGVSLPILFVFTQTAPGQP